MKKVFKLDELDCANCARKMEDLIKAIDGVDFASVNFFAQKLTLEAGRAEKGGKGREKDRAGLPDHPLRFRG